MSVQLCGLLANFKVTQMQAGEKSKEQVQGKLVFEKKQLGATTQLAYGVKTIDMLNSII